MNLDWPDCRNVRDLGGLPTADGGRIRPGALIRSDSHFRLTATGVAALRSAGVTRIIDLRWRWECEQFPSPFAADPIYRHVPMLTDVLGYDPPHDSYAPMLDHNGARIADAFGALATAPPGGVVVHCHGGRDRTGGLVALALAVAGVPPEVIADDYGRTDGTDPAAMRTTLRHVDDVHGGVDAYLDRIGVPRPQVDAVRNRLRTDLNSS